MYNRHNGRNEPIIMRAALAVIVLSSLGAELVAQPGMPSANPPPPQAAVQTSTQGAGPSFNAILSALQQATQTANLDLTRLRIEKWKADGSDKQEMERIAASLQKNLTVAVPGLISEAQAAPGSVVRAFKLYDNITIVYEYLSSLSEAAGAYGKKEEYEPLGRDLSALDNARRNLSDYIEQAANTLETPRKPPPTVQAQPAPTPKKIVIDDDNPPPKKTVKKKKPSPTPTPSPTPSQ
jgi:hypothetical protein